MFPLYRAARRAPSKQHLALLVLLCLVPQAAAADAVFDRAAGLSPPPAGARAVGQGSGFFIGGDGLLLTAAHLVADCRRIDVVGGSDARPGAVLLRSDPDSDLAALRGAGPSAALALARRPPRGDAPLTVLGFPEDVTGAAPARLPAILRNRQADRFDAANPRASEEIILRGAVRHGDSGGPILDRAGQVIGLVQGILPDAAEVRASYGLTESDIAVGPGLTPIRRLIAQIRLVPGGAGAAVVRVLCWK